MTKLTALETQTIQGILDSDFMDGMTGADAVKHMVWTWSANPFASKKTFSGTVSSLVQKGFVGVADMNTRDAVIWITQAGMDAFESKE